MKMPGSGPAHKAQTKPEHRRWGWLVAFGCIAVILAGILAPRKPAAQSPKRTPSDNLIPHRDRTMSSTVHRESKPAPTAEQIVADRVEHFARDRLRIARAMAKRLN